MNLASLDEPPAYGRRREAPLITFGIPAYQRPELLHETLASLIRQTGGHDFEVVVCDDGGLPATARVVAEFPADRFSLYFNQPALGGVGNWNRCLQRARGRWVMILHEDDLLYPWYLDTVVPRLCAGASAVCTRVVQGAAPPLLAPPAGRPAVRRYLPLYFIKSSFTPFPGVLFPGELGRRLGGFDARHGPLADYEFWYRLACAGRVEVVRQVAAFYRTSPDQWTARDWPAMIRQVHLLRRQVALQQLGRRPLAFWLARFFSYRDARAYARRFPGRPASLQRVLGFRRIPLSGLPSGWVWQLLKLLA